MKKLSIFLACLAAMIGFTSCEQDRDPVLQTPTKFVLNTPAFQNQYYMLAPGNTFELTCSQPDYGYSAVSQYSAEVSLTEDFAKYESLKTVTTSARMVLDDDDLAVALCKLHGFDNEETYQDLPAGKIYLRAVAQLSGVDGSMIKSNPVALNYVKFYFALPQAGYIYLVGSPEGWAGPVEGNADHYAKWRLFEKSDEIGSKVYYGTFEMPATPMFRFYTALTGWDPDSYGSQVDDAPVDVELVAGTAATPVVKGKGNFNFPGITAPCKMELKVDMSVKNNFLLTVTVVE